ncbi:Adenosylmethionine-8-amino-7-oxononanoate aminotransferase [Nitrospira japonica]|uniref:Adenosylmethionine-8-amino-7-oxononanoate aminotransferase n=1 Tax=Nitrospira japonica TaxID=1325564 RepID=A0A1W1IB56_9BACT|nr:adenosylmethionine--8-amino-7-oxononanoate transaminase [Nitrospira japonica]SLM50151.1 Adenosylmethionine-8-amino-7-oxononanoate aminotransferase [Nitrospira japonica]
MQKRVTTTQLGQWDRTYLWHPFTQMQEWETEEPLIIERGTGVYLIDRAGRKYLDGTSSIWVNLHGHRHRILDRALRDQLNRIAHSTLLGLSNTPAILLARELIRLAPKGLRRVFYSDDGSTAVEAALKMAVQYWQQHDPAAGPKHLFLHLKLAYHGDTIGAVSVGNIEAFHSRFKPLLFPTLEADPPYCYRCPLNLRFPSCKIACLDPIEQIMRARGHELAGVIIEPLVQAAAGMITAPPGYLKRLRELCTRYNILLIADEVATGFGRTGKMFACHHEDVTPDLMAISKGITGGYMPLAATLATENIYAAFRGTFEELKTFFHGHSYTGNQLGCAVALANLAVFRKERTLVRLRPKIAVMTRLLNSMTSLRHVGDIRQQGFMAGIELVKNKQSREPYPFEMRIGHRVAQEARGRGLLLRPLGNVMVLMPPLATTVPALTRMVTLLRESIQQVTDSRSGQ